MTGSNLPPGCNIGDIPGNRPEDMEAEAIAEETEAMVEAIDKLNPSVDEIRMLRKVAIAMLIQHRKVQDVVVKDSLVDKQMEHDHFMAEKESELMQCEEELRRSRQCGQKP